MQQTCQSNWTSMIKKGGAEEGRRERKKEGRREERRERRGKK